MSPASRRHWTIVGIIFAIGAAVVIGIAVANGATVNL